MTHEADAPSWDAQRTQAPQRPRFASSLPPEDLIPRPRRVIVAMVLAVAAAAAWVAIATLGAIDVESLRLSLVDALPDDLRADYEEATQRSAASIMLGVVAGLGTLVTVVHLLAARAATFDRSALARVVGVVATVVQIPVMALAVLLVGDAPTSVALAAAVPTCSIAAVALLLTPRASRWLRQGEPPRSIPIAAPAP